VFTLQHAADQYAKFPKVTKRIKDNFYSDNMIDSFETDGEAIDFAQAVIESLESGVFNLIAFGSSSTAVLNTIPCHHRSSKQVDLNLDNPQLEYQLGMEWDSAADTYSIRAKQFPQVTTRRQLLSAISLIFHPLGLSPVQNCCFSSRTGLQ
jgi:hypothetical protein